MWGRTSRSTAASSASPSKPPAAPGRGPPPLSTSTSTCPNASTAASTIRSGAAGSVRSTATGTADGSEAASSAALSAERPTITTFAPSSPNPRAIAAPMPEVPPSTTAVRASSPRSITVLLRVRAGRLVGHDRCDRRPRAGGARAAASGGRELAARAAGRPECRSTPRRCSSILRSASAIPAWPSKLASGSHRDHVSRAASKPPVAYASMAARRPSGWLKPVIAPAAPMASSSMSPTPPRPPNTGTSVCCVSWPTAAASAATRP